jgi:hypothetical protein
MVIPEQYKPKSVTTYICNGYEFPIVNNIIIFVKIENNKLEFLNLSAVDNMFETSTNLSIYSTTISWII